MVLELDGVLHRRQRRHGLQVERVVLAEPRIGADALLVVVFERAAEGVADESAPRRDRAARSRSARGFATVASSVSSGNCSSGRVPSRARPADTATRRTVALLLDAEDLLLERLEVGRASGRRLDGVERDRQRADADLRRRGAASPRDASAHRDPRPPGAGSTSASSIADGSVS